MAVLGNTETTFASSAPRHDSGSSRTQREAALRLRETLWNVSSLDDVRKCGRVRFLPELTFEETPAGPRMRGLCRCHSVWVCPVCAPEIRALRGHQIAGALLAHLSNGGGAEFGTLTVPHGSYWIDGKRVQLALRDTYSVVASSWSAMNRNSAVSRFRKSRGYWGFVRTCEITQGDLNGWHPHVHFVEFWERPLTLVERSAYRALLFEGWGSAVTRRGYGRPSWAHGLRVVQITKPSDSTVLGEYLTEFAAGAELTSLSTKEAARHGRTPLDLLRAVSEYRGDPRVVALWHEYEQATRGRRMLGWSNGLRDRVGVPEADPDADGVGLGYLGRLRTEDFDALTARPGGFRGCQGVLERAAEDGQTGINRAVRALLGLSPLQAPSPGVAPLVQLSFSPVEEVGF